MVTCLLLKQNIIGYLLKTLERIAHFSTKIVLGPHFFCGKNKVIKFKEFNDVSKKFELFGLVFPREIL